LVKASKNGFTGIASHMKHINNSDSLHNADTNMSLNSNAIPYSQGVVGPSKFQGFSKVSQQQDVVNNRDEGFKGKIRPGNYIGKSNNLDKIFNNISTKKQNKIPQINSVNLEDIRQFDKEKI
jgi:predicted transcriptional regulator